MLSSLSEQDQLIRRRVVEPASRAWASFLAGFAVNPTSGDNDPSIRWPLLLFRWVLTGTYVCTSVLIGLGQEPAWVIATIGYLVIYHLATTLHTTVHMRRGRPVTWFWELIPFADIVAVSLILASVSSVTLPVWVVYFLIAFGASISRGSSYVLTLTGACMAGYAGAVASHLAAGQQVPWADVIVIVIMMALGGWLATIRASFERVLYQDLNESEARYRDLYEDAPNAYFSVGVDARIRRANRAAEELLGYTADELVGKPVYDLYADTPTGKAKAQEVFSRFVAGEETLGEELEMRRADGRHVWISLSARALRDAEGQIEETRSVVVDITERKQAEEALRFTQFSVDRAAEPAFWMTSDGHIFYVNDAACRSLGYTPEELLSMTIFDIDDDITPEAWPKHWRELTERGTSTIESRHRAKDGRLFPVEVSASYLEFDGRGYNCCFARDITERKQAEEALARASRQNEMILNSAVEGIYGLDLDGNTTFVNRAAAKMIGWEPEELIGKAQHDVLHHSRADGSPYPRDECPIYAAFKDGTTHQMESEVFWRKDGTSFPVEYASTPILDEQDEPTGAVVSFSDITERKRAEETIRHLAYHDALTGLPNRTLFTDRLNLALAQARRGRHMIAVLFLDLDHFKVVNDTIGHATGDQLLRSAAERLTSVVREGDTVARMGGDEFTVLLPNIVGVEDATEVAKRAIEACRRPWNIAGHEFHVTTSIGIAIYPNDGEDAESLIRNADTAMYRAKEQGRDNYEPFTAAMNASMVERMALENSLRHGLERDEFVVHYQPQVDISSGRIVGTEALVRWQHPERGLVSPMEFIPAAEEIGLILSLDEWVMRTACAQNVAWQQAGHTPIPVAANLSARQFQGGDLLDTVAKVLEESGMDPRYLQFEITEGVAMKDAESTITTLSALREMGIRIAIDDFGTGHSSLSYLKRFPIDVLKIDRSFVRDLSTDPNDAAIASTIIAMAKSLSLRVIAEGVETEEQLAFLKEHGCDEMQGFLFSKPVPAEEFEEILKRSSRPQASARKRG